MNKHKIIIRLLVFWHVFISAFSLLLFFVRIENGEFIGDNIKYYEEYYDIVINITVRDYLEWYGFNVYLILIAIVALTSGMCLLVKKRWGRILGIILGVILIPFGVYLFIFNFMATVDLNPSFIDRIISYFQTMGASLNYIDLTSIFYGIFAIIYFTRKNVKSYINLSSDSKAKEYSN